LGDNARLARPAWLDQANELAVVANMKRDDLADL
jgi:hypothetical protein